MARCFSIYKRRLALTFWFLSLSMLEHVIVGVSVTFLFLLMLRRTIHQQLSTHQQLWIGRLFQRLNLWRPSGWTVVGCPGIWQRSYLKDLETTTKNMKPATISSVFQPSVAEFLVRETSENESRKWSTGRLLGIRFLSTTDPRDGWIPVWYSFPFTSLFWSLIRRSEVQREEHRKGNQCTNQEKENQEMNG